MPINPNEKHAEAYYIPMHCSAENGFSKTSIGYMWAPVLILISTSTKVYKVYYEPSPTRISSHFNPGEPFSPIALYFTSQWLSVIGIDR